MPTQLPPALSIMDLWATDISSGATVHNVSMVIPAGQVVVEDPHPENIRLFADCLTGAHRPFHGQVKVAATPLPDTDQEALTLWRQTMIHPLQPPALQGRASIEECVAGAERSQTGASPTHRTQAVLDRVGLLGISTKAVADTTPEQAVALELACALIWNPTVLLSNEPQTRLGPAGLSNITTLLQDLAHLEGRTVLITTSSPSAIPSDATTISL